MALTRLIDIAAVPNGEGRAVALDGIEPIAVFNVGGTFFVTQDTCSHAKASLTEGWLEGHEVCCPVHDGRFDLCSGKALCFPATDPIQTFTAQVQDGAVWADISTARPGRPAKD